MPIPEVMLLWKPLDGQSGHQAGRQLLQQLYFEKTGMTLPPIAITSRGKPYFPDSPLHFSITHTPYHAFCALAEVPVGIDAEERSRTVNPRLAEKILSPGEQIRWRAADDPNEALLRLWVLKEAAVKLTGEGLKGYPNHTDFSPDDPRIQIIDGCVVAVLKGE